MRICEYSPRIGDRVRTNGNGRYAMKDCIDGVVGEIREKGFFVFHNDGRYDTEFELVNDPEDYGKRYAWYIRKDNEAAMIDCYGAEGKNIGKRSQDENKNMFSNIREKFVTFVTPEPYKSFRKAGIVDGDNLLTADGVKVFLAWLLEKKGADFKTDIVDPMLKELKEEKDC